MIKIKVGVSARHAHVTKEVAKKLFGGEGKLTSARAISQVGQFSTKETLALKTARGTLAHVRIVGPARAYNQVELALTDAIHLGLQPEPRMSGDHKGTPGLTLIGPKGKVRISKGVILAHRHIHASPKDLKKFKLKPGQKVSVETKGKRAVVFRNVLIKTHPSFVWRFHLDTDEANAAGVADGYLAKVFTQKK